MYPLNNVLFLNLGDYLVSTSLYVVLPSLSSQKYVLDSLITCILRIFSHSRLYTIASEPHLVPPILNEVESVLSLKTTKSAQAEMRSFSQLV